MLYLKMALTKEAEFSMIKRPFAMVHEIQIAIKRKLIENFQNSGPVLD
jgi:hypothetical protein